jgi:hypothetical protein
MQIKVKKHGPVFDGRAEKALHDFTKAAKQDIADQGVTEVRTALSGVLKHPTGHYSSRVQYDNRSDDYAITDGGVVYGPWLEGVGSRNMKTRFKGYSTFRKVTQRLQKKAVQIAERSLPQYLRRMK